jgi:ketosteroid isomerase-like protein
MSIVDPAIIEFANEALYLAFNNRDLGQMDDLWADEHSCVCIHPGWKPVHGKEEIMASWRGIFTAQGEADRINCHEPSIISYGDFHVVTCYEELGAGWLIATNCFVLEGDKARLCYHQAGQCMEPPEFEPEERTLQ